MKNRYAKILMLVSCINLLVSPRLYAQNKKPMDLFLLIGQSNMAGSTPIGDLDTLTLQNVYLFNDQNSWEKAKNTVTEGINRYATVRSKANPQLSLGYNFAKKLAAYTGHEIGLVANARGGTAILWWQKGYTGTNDFDLYEQAILRAKAALAATPGAKIKGIIWHQGEGDNSKAASPLYMQRLKQLVNDLRTDLGDMNIPFVAGEVGTWNNRGTGVNPVIRTIEANITHATWVSTAGLTSLDLEKNNPHFDTFSQRVFGGRYADKTAELIYNIKPTGVTLFSSANYFGRSVLLGNGDYNAVDLESAGLKPTEILSLKVDKGYEILLFTEKDAAPVKITNDNPGLNGTVVSKIRIEPKAKK